MSQPPVTVLALGATYVKGRVVLDDQWAYDTGLTRMALVDGECLAIQIERLDEARSREANAYMWSVVLKAISEHTGESAEALHEYFKLRFNPMHLHINGEEVAVARSTAKLNRMEFFDYVERVRQFAAEELDLVTPDPDPLWRFRPKKPSPDLVAQTEAQPVHAAL